MFASDFPVFLLPASNIWSEPLAATELEWVRQTDSWMCEDEESASEHIVEVVPCVGHLF